MNPLLDSTSREFGQALAGYRVCLLWVMPGSDECENPGDACSLSDFAFEANVKTHADLLEFLQQCERAGLLGFIPDAYSNERLGHDFALTRNGHGAGFWDREELDLMTEGIVPVNLGDALSEIASAMHESNLYIGDTGMVYAE